MPKIRIATIMIFFQIEVDEEKTTLSPAETIPLAVSTSLHKVVRKNNIIPTAGL
jgi:hypothetical protein